MLLRATAEQHWTNNMSSTDQAAWVARWLTRPPLDAYGRVYFLGPKTETTQTVRPAPTIFAWSQLFGVYRFGNDFADTPTDDFGRTVDVKVTSADNKTLTILAKAREDDGATYPLLCYASPALSPGQTPVPKKAAFLAAFPLYIDNSPLDLFPWWNTWYSPVNGADIVLMCYSISETNTLSPAGTGAIVTQEWS